MYKILIITAIFFSGCSNFTVTAAMCENLRAKPGSIVPQECQAYSEKKADKAFNKVVNEKKVSDSDIEFHIKK